MLMPGSDTDVSSKAVDNANKDWKATLRRLRSFSATLEVRTLRTLSLSSGDTPQFHSFTTSSPKRPVRERDSLSYIQELQKKQLEAH